MCNPISLENHYSDNLQKAVGLLFITASNTEAVLGMQVARCLCHPHTLTPQSALSCAGIELKTKLRQIEIATQVAFPNEVSAIKKITSSIRRMFDHRNAIAHNANEGPNDTLNVTPLKLGSKGIEKTKPLNAAQITNFARVMHARTRQLDDSLTSIGFVKLPKEPS